jgi:DNA-binding response OmpR family regulator
MPPGTRILIVDDEEIFAENLGTYFRKRSAEVRVVPSGEAAIEAASEFRPDVLILDYGLPGIDGIETFTRLRGLPLRCGCVMITGEPSESIPRAARATGIRHVLEKPFLLSEIEGIIAFQLTEQGAADECRPSWKRRTTERRFAGVIDQGCSAPRLSPCEISAAATGFPS